MLPQMFYPAMNNMTITKGDTLAARCTMVSDRSRITSIGYEKLKTKLINPKKDSRNQVNQLIVNCFFYRSTNDDEMCNFYMM